jgi:phosphatidylglycerophosphatase GEP4
MGIPVLTHFKKPANPEILIGHFKCRGDEIVMVGDRILTDVVYGNKIDAFTILTTNIITTTNDNKIAVQVRKFENWVLGFFSGRRIHPRGKFVQTTKK